MKVFLNYNKKFIDGIKDLDKVLDMLDIEFVHVSDNNDEDIKNIQECDAVITINFDDFIDGKEIKGSVDYYMLAKMEIAKFCEKTSYLLYDMDLSSGKIMDEVMNLSPIMLDGNITNIKKRKMGL